MNFISFSVHFNSPKWLLWGSRLGGRAAAPLTSRGAGGWGTVLVPDKGQYPVPTLAGTLLIHPSAGRLLAPTGSWLNCNASNTPQSAPAPQMWQVVQVKAERRSQRPSQSLSTTQRRVWLGAGRVRAGRHDKHG